MPGGMGDDSNGIGLTRRTSPVIVCLVPLMKAAPPVRLGTKRGKASVSAGDRLIENMTAGVYANMGSRSKKTGLSAHTKGITGGPRGACFDTLRVHPFEQPLLEHPEGAGACRPPAEPREALEHVEGLAHRPLIVA